MRIYNINPINFTASFVNKEHVGIYEPETNSYKNTEVSFVQLNPLDRNDIKTLDKIANSWIYDKFSVNIYNSAYDYYSKKNKHQINNYYALTTQKDNFDILDHEKVLGLADIVHLDRHNGYLSHLQVNPEYVYGIQPKYKGSGTAILNSLKKIYSHIRLLSMPEKSVQNFYLRNGFKKVSEDKLKYIWSRY